MLLHCCGCLILSVLGTRTLGITHDGWKSSAILGSLWLLRRSCSVTRNPKSPWMLCAMRKAHLSQNTAWYFEQLHQGFWSSIKDGKSYHITLAAAAVNTGMLYSSLLSSVSKLLRTYSWFEFQVSSLLTSHTHTHTHTHTYTHTHPRGWLQIPKTFIITSKEHYFA